MADDFAAKVGVFLAGKLVLPVLAWASAKTIGWGAGGLSALSQTKQVGLLLAGMGGATYLLIQPEKSLDYLLGGVATAANTTSQVLGVVANQVRTLEKVDIEAFMNRQVEFLGPYFAPTDNEVDTDNKENKVRALPAPPPLLPKDYTMQNFPFFLKPRSKIRFINDTDVDPLIEAYAILGIDVVSMILQDRQLPQIKLVKDIYIEHIRHVHPDKNLDFEGANQLASIVNLSYTKIKNMMKSADEQAEFITPILQHFHKGYFPPTPYIILFFMGGAFAVWLAA